MPETKTAKAYITDDGKTQTVEASLKDNEVHIYLGGDTFRGSFRFHISEAIHIADTIMRLVQ